MRAGENCIRSYIGVNVMPHSVPLVYFPHLSSVFLIFSNSSPPLISPLLLLLLLSSTAHPCLLVKPRLSSALHPFFYLCALTLSSSSFLLSPLLPEPASPRVVQPGVKTQ